MVSFLAKIKNFKFWPKTMDYYSQVCYIILEQLNYDVII